MPAMLPRISGVNVPDVGEPRRELDLGFQEARAPQLDSLDPMDPRSAVDPVVASEEEILGAIGPDPFRLTDPREQLRLFDSYGGVF